MKRKIERFLNKKGTVMQIEKKKDKLSITCFKNILKVSHFNFTVIYL